MGKAEPPMISIIIPAHNEEEFLPGTLEALNQQTYRNFETVVVTNGCTDNTAEAVRGKCTQLYELEERGLGPARNLGAVKARGNLLLFLDADTILEPNALQVIARKFMRRHSAGTLRGVPDQEKTSYKVIYFLKNFVHKSHAHHGSSGVILCWKDHFEAVGGFDNELYLRENSDLMKKLRQFGGYKYISATPAITSMRRYERTGTAEMVLLWLKVWVLSNFSDIRNQTYEGMSQARQPRLSKLGQWLVNMIEKRRDALRTRNAPVGW
jgi:glycosyltransferase involved in cell wall biosynthesis